MNYYFWLKYWSNWFKRERKCVKITLYTYSIGWALQTTRSAESYSMLISLNFSTASLPYAVSMERHNVPLNSCHSVLRRVTQQQLGAWITFRPRLCEIKGTMDPTSRVIIIFCFSEHDLSLSVTTNLQDNILQFLVFLYHNVFYPRFSCNRR